jgi:hypothetical protein
MSFELHNKKIILNVKTWHRYYTWIALLLYVDRYGGDFAEKYGSRYLDIQVFAFFSFLGHWKGIKDTSMHNVHNSIHLVMN